MGTPLRKHRPAATRFDRLATVLGATLAAAALLAWEGHDWNRWKEVTTWRKPALRTDQAGRRDLVPLLGRPATGGQPGPAPTDWPKRREEWAATIQAVLGTPGALTPPRPEARVLGEDDFVDHVRRRVLIRSEPEDWIPAWLLIPKPAPAGRAPAMICLHQTVAQGKAEPCGVQGDPELAFALELVRRGFVCLAPDAIGFGERIPPGTQPYHDSLAFYRRHPGWSFMGKMVWDVSRAVDYLETLPFVDPQRIGSVGHSHGAYGTLFAAAFEPRLSVAVASCGFTPFRNDPSPERWSHATALIPQLGMYLPDVASIPFDWQHVLALIAPRHLFVWYATKDSIFPGTESLGPLLEDVRQVYSLLGATHALAGQAFDGPHQFPKAGRETAWRWLEASMAEPPNRASGARSVDGRSSTAPATAAPSASPRTALKPASAFFPGALVARARANAGEHAWAREARDRLVAAAAPWRGKSDDELWDLMFGNTIRRSWQVWSDGHCPGCREPVPMYEWVADALEHPWKLRCPRCREWFPKNDFARFYRSGLDEQGIFDPRRADRSLLYNVEHPDPTDPQHRFGVDDGDGYVEDGKRWRFIGAYLIFGQWKQAVVNGIRNLAAAYVATGEAVYAHKAGVLLDRVADLYPTFDFGREGVLYEGPARAGYVSTWHDACVEVHDLALAYDAVFEGLAADTGLVEFLAAKAAAHPLDRPKTSMADIRRNIEQRIFRDTLEHRPKIESNYPSTDITLVTLETVLEWPANRATVMSRLDEIIRRSTAVDGLSGEKGLTGYSVIAPHTVAALLGRYTRTDPGFLGEMLRRHPQLHAMYRFHLDTWCLGQYYPRTGDTGSFAERTPSYVGLPFSRQAGIEPSSYTFLWQLYEATGDADFVRLLYGANQASTAGLPYDVFAADPAAFQAKVAAVIAERGAALRLASVNKTQWGLAILRSGEGPDARAVWLDYDSGERHGHADGLNLGLFAKSLDLLPDFGYPPVQYGGWSAPRAVWYTQTAAHNTVMVDGKNTVPGTGTTPLWFDGGQCRVVCASAPKLVGARQYERTVVVVDLSPRDFYLVDLFRVTGGSQHTKFLHAGLGRLETSNLNLVAVEEPRFGEVMRGFRRDPAPPEGWTADWAVEDRFGYLPRSSAVHLRYTDLTRGAEVLVAEGWVSLSSIGGTAEAWIPRFLVRRATVAPPLVSTFVGVLEPYEGGPEVVGVRRLDLRDAQGPPRPESDLGLELRLADGRRDVLLSVSCRGAADPNPSPAAAARVVEPQSGLRFEGELCLVRFDTAGQPCRVLFCQGRALERAGLVVEAQDPTASFELDLDRRDGPVVAGAAEAVRRIEVGGERLWPK